jgi:hypothetical protein
MAALPRSIDIQIATLFPQSVMKAHESAPKRNAILNNSFRIELILSSIFGYCDSADSTTKNAESAVIVANRCHHLQCHQNAKTPITI